MFEVHAVCFKYEIFLCCTRYTACTAQGKNWFVMNDQLIDYFISCHSCYLFDYWIKKHDFKTVVFHCYDGDYMKLSHYY